MALLTGAPAGFVNVVTQDSEVDFIDRLTVASAQSGVQAERADIANLYVALKERPMAILVGPCGNGKAAVVECLASLLTGSATLHRQVVPGHAWYVGGRPVNGSLIEMHTRLVTEKLLCITEEALQPENVQQVFVVGLTHISPAELLSFFTELAYQIQNNRIMRIGDAHLTSPLPFPPNLLLIGTMDTTDFDWWDDDLLSSATIIEWRGPAAFGQPAAASESPDFGRTFLRSQLRNAQKAYERLLACVAGTREPLTDITRARNVLQTHSIEFSYALLEDVILYLANAWSALGNGLFDPSTSRNLAVASDLALAQLVLPRNITAIRGRPSLQRDLHSVLDEHLPRSGAFMRRHCEGYSSPDLPKGI